MLSKCANPNCRAPFHYWREGRLVIVRHGKRNHETLEYFWFCGACAPSYTLMRSDDGMIAVKPCGSTAAVPDRAAGQSFLCA